MENEKISLDDIIETKPQKSKKKRKLWPIILYVVGALVVALSIFTAVVWSDYSGSARNGETVTVTVKQGASVSAIARELENQGAIGNGLFFRIYSKLAKTENLYNYGTFTFKNDIGFEAISDILINGGAKAETVRVVIPEGTGINDYTKNVNGNKVTVKGIATILEDAGVCTRDDFFAALKEFAISGELLSATSDKAYYRLEGYLFPETYEFYFHDSKECAKLAIEKMVAETEKRITDDMRKKAASMGYTINDILTMASIVQMEAGGNSSESIKQMPSVAAVFYNRLKSSAFSTLGSSPTCYYGNSFANDDGRYDTYKVKGLPPGPLCSVGTDAINAALYPTEKTEYYYFVTDKNGKFYFHKTGNEQQATINRLQQEGNWIYEYFD